VTATRTTRAVRVTGTATFRRVLAGLAVGLVCVGCGTSYGPAGGTPRHTASTSAGAGDSSAAGSSSGGSAASPSTAFGWFTAKAPPSSWRLARISTGAALPYPASWKVVHSDPGTFTAALKTGRGSFLGYLNLTPRQGEETLSNWRSFRIEHNREEGDTHVRKLAVAESLHFRTGHGNCVKDSYLGGTGVHYVEIACLIAGSHSSVVAVGAAPPAAWPRQAAVIERAIEGVEA
jgi:hypothetical protein